LNDCAHQTEGKLIKERLEAALKEGQSAVLNQNDLRVIAIAIQFISCAKDSLFQAYPPLPDTGTAEEQTLDEILQTDRSQYSFRPLQSFTTPMCERCATSCGRRLALCTSEWLCVSYELERKADRVSAGSAKRAKT